MKRFNSVIGIFALMLTFSASAHISIKQSTPMQSATLMQSPKQLSLTFSDKVRLAKVILNDAQNKSVNFDFKPNSTPNTDFNWSLPSLAQGPYTVKWVALGGDGHKMSGTLDFKVNKTADDKAMMQKHVKAQSHHNH